MRRLHTLLGTGCFFLWAGGWVYSDRVNAADPPNTVADPAAVLQGAVGPAATLTPAAPAATTAPATSEPIAKNLSVTDMKVSPDGVVDQINVQDLDINSALRLLAVQSKRNIIVSKEVKGSVTVNLYNVTFTEALEAMLVPNGFGYLEKGNFIYVYTKEELKKIKDAERKTVTRVFQLKYLVAVDASVLLKPVLSSTGQMSLTPPALAGLPDGIADPGGQNYATQDTLVISDYPENLDEAAKILHQLDVRPKQVLIESTILSATLQEDNSLGVNFVSLSGLDFSSLGGAKATSDVMNLFQGVTPTNTPDSTVKAGPTKAAIGTDPTTGGLSVGFLSNNINVFISALESVTDTTVVANPKILALNKHRGEVFIGSQLGYMTNTITQTSNTQTVAFLDTGTKLVFRPFITDDGYVRMEVHPEDSSANFSSTGTPGKDSTEVTSNLMIKDGRTVVIGGMFKETTAAGRGQVPVLGNIPILGIPFRQTSDSTIRKEIIVLLTPHIINDDTALYEESAKRQEDVTRMMLGNRAGLQPWGRDRIAQTWYAEAQKCLAAGNPDKALMYTDWALNTNPRFLEAIRLREQLTHQKMQDATESSMADFVRTVIRADAATIPDTGGAAHPPTPVAAPAKP